MPDQTDQPAASKGDDRHRINITVRPLMRRYLNQLKKIGVYGDDHTTVAGRLVEEGIRRALESGIIHPETRDEGE